MVRILGRRGYHTAQCTKSRKLGESVPDFESTLVSYEHLLHEQSEKVLFLCIWDGFHHALQVGEDFMEEVFFYGWQIQTKYTAA